MHQSMELPCNRCSSNWGVNRLLQKKPEYIIIFQLRISICSGLSMHNKCFNSSGSMPSACFYYSWIIIIYFPKYHLWFKNWGFLWVWLNLKGKTTACYLRYFQVSVLTEWGNGEMGGKGAFALNRSRYHSFRQKYSLDTCTIIFFLAIFCQKLCIMKETETP